MSKVDKEKILRDIKFLAKKRRYNDAARRMEEYLELNPNDHYSKVYYAMLLNKIGEYNEAVKILDNLFDENNLSDQKTLLFAYSQYAHTMTNMKEYDEAIHFYNLTIDNSYNDELESRSELARIYFSENKIGECFEILTLPNKESRFLSVKKAMYYLKQHKYRQAIKQLEKNKNLPWDKEHGFDESFLEQEENYLLGHAYLSTNKNEEALKYLNKACTNKSSRNYYKAYFDIAYIKNRENKHNEAIIILKNLLDNKNASFISYKIYSELGKAYLKKGDVDNAKKQFLEVSNAYGQQSFLLAKLECSKGNFSKAEEKIKEAQSLSPELFPELYYYKVLIKFRLKKYDEVNDLISKSEELFVKNTYSYTTTQLQNDLKLIKLIIDKELGKETKINDNTSYIEKQIIDYSVDRTIEYIKDNHFDYKKISRYKDDSNINDIIAKVQDKLVGDLIFQDSTFDKYIVSYSGVGLDYNNNEINQLIVLTLPNTKNIIGMYPFDAEDNINYTKSDDSNTSGARVYRMSQIDKFKAKYGDRY